LLKQLYLLLPLVLLVYLVGTSQNTIAYAAAYAIVVAIAVSMFSKETRLTPARLLQALAAGGQGMITVAVACGIAGIVAGLITSTGLATMVIGAIVDLAGNQLIIALFLTMLCCIVLGMGVPTTANYCIMAATCAPILIEMGVPALAAHFFVFYFGIVADLTPPVALAAYAGAAIGQANPMKTAVTATKLAIGAFIVPYVFALNPAMLFIDGGNIFEILLIGATSLVCIFGVASALEGYLLTHMKWYERIMAVVGGLLLVDPELATDFIGIGILAVVILLQMMQKKKNRPLQA
jgi:TRAP transporter 4TM/12TM fusion protein